MISNERIKEAYEKYIKEFKENPEKIFKQSLKEVYIILRKVDREHEIRATFGLCWNLAFSQFEQVAYRISEELIYKKLLNPNNVEVSTDFIQINTGVKSFNTLEIIEDADAVRRHYAKELILDGDKEENYYVDTPKFDKNSKISERNCKIYVEDIEFSKNINWLFTSENFRYNIKTLNGLTFRFANGETLVNVGTQHPIDELSKKRHKIIMKYTREIERIIRELNISSETLENLWNNEFIKLKI